MKSTFYTARVNQNSQLLSALRYTRSRVTLQFRIYNESGEYRGNHTILLRGFTGTEAYRIVFEALSQSPDISSDNIETENT